MKEVFEETTTTGASFFDHLLIRKQVCLSTSRPCGNAEGLEGLRWWRIQQWQRHNDFQAALLWDARRNNHSECEVSVCNTLTSHSLPGLRDFFFFLGGGGCCLGHNPWIYLPQAIRVIRCHQWEPRTSWLNWDGSLHDWRQSLCHQWSGSSFLLTHWQLAVLFDWMRLTFLWLFWARIFLVQSVNVVTHPSASRLPPLQSFCRVPKETGNQVLVLGIKTEEWTSSFYRDLWSCSSSFRQLKGHRVLLPFLYSWVRLGFLCTLGTCLYSSLWCGGKGDVTHKRDIGPGCQSTMKSRNKKQG